MDDVFCNECWEEVGDKAFRLPCSHLFCEGCTNRQLSLSGRCPFCSKDFGTGDVLEFQIVGSRVNETELRELRAMLHAVGVANGAAYVEELARQVVELEKEQLEGALLSFSVLRLALIFLFALDSHTDTDLAHWQPSCTCRASTCSSCKVCLARRSNSTTRR